MSDDWDLFAEEVVAGDDLVAEVARLKKERDRLARQLHDVKHKHADYLETVHTAVSEAVSRIEVPVVRVPPARASSGRTAIALLSDLQTGKVTPDYNTEVCRERVLSYADKIIEIGRENKIRHCVVPILGDVLENCDIFPGQQYLIDSTLYAQVFESTPTIIADFLRRLAGYFASVRVEAVQGNHGRIGRRGQFSGADNADKMVYRVTKLLLRNEPRIEFNIADREGAESAWYKIMQVGNYSALLFHGDQVRGHSGIPWYGFQKKVNSWASGGIGPGVTFDDAMCGHFHQLARIPLNQRTVWVNGSIESYNTFAQEQLAGQSEPMQWVLICDPEEGVIVSSYGVRLRT